MAKRAFRIEDVNATREMMQVVASPDGALVVMAVTELAPDGNRNVSRLWMVDASSPEGARPITRGDRNASSPAFSPDGKRLAYLAEVEKEKTQLVVLATPFSECVVLTRFEHGVRAFDWIGSDRLMVVAPADRLPAKRQALDRRDDAYEVNVDEPRARMWIVPVEGGPAKPLGPAGGHVSAATASSDGKLVACIWSEHSTLEVLWGGSELRVVDVRAGRSRCLRKLFQPLSAGLPPRFSPDAKRVAFVDTPRKGEVYPCYVYVADVATAKVRLATAKRRGAGRADPKSDQVQWNPKWLDSSTLLWCEQRGVRRALVAAEPGQASREIETLPGSVGEYAVLASSRVAFVYSETSKPPELYECDPASSRRSRDSAVASPASSLEPKKLTSLNRKFDGVALSEGRIVRWTSREGWTVEGILHLPTTRARAPFTCDVIPHGGPHGAISNGWDRPNAHVFASRGIATFWPNFRGSTGYGEKFLLAIRGDWGKGPADDIARGVEALAKKRLIDKSRLVVSGGSYGGFMTAWLIGHYDYFRAAVAHAPVVHNLSMWGTTDIPTYMEWSLGASPLRDPEVYRRMSPVAWLKKCRVPTLVVVGDRDERVPPGQAQELYRTLKAAGAPARLVRYPREPHGIGEPRHKADLVRRMVDWFERHLK